MLSNRGQRNAAWDKVPWRFAPGWGNRYHKDTNPNGVVIFGAAENRLLLGELALYVNEKVRFPPIAFTYQYSSGGGPKFPSAMAAHLNECFDPWRPVKPDDVVTTSAVTAMNCLLAFSIGDPGDALLTGRPVYGRFELDFGNFADLDLVYADMKGADPFGVGAVRRYEIALEDALAKGIKIRAILIVNPNNPTGRCYTKEALIGLMQLAEKHDLHLISDEIYALSVFDNGQENAVTFTSVLSIAREGIISDDRVHVLYGMAKDFSAPGVKIGCIITNNASLKDAITSNLRFHGASGLSLAVATRILEDRAFVDSFTKLARERIRDAYMFTTKTLEGAGVPYWKGGNAGFFVFMDLSKWLLPTDQTDELPEFELAQTFLDAGVGLHPREEHWEEPGFYRMVFTMERHILEEGLKRFLRVLKRRAIKLDGLAIEATRKQLSNSKV